MGVKESNRSLVSDVVPALRASGHCDDDVRPRPHGRGYFLPALRA